MEMVMRYKYWIMGAVVVIALIYFMSDDSDEPEV
jgi:lipopolysaccharide export system protein LptC